MMDKRFQKLKEIAEESSISEFVAQEALDYAENSPLENLFSQLFEHGCVSGMISPLIYYTDTHAFFDEH